MQALELHTQGAVFVDIRDPESFAQGHIPGARALDNQSVAAFIAQTPQNTPIIVSCYHGHSSQSAVQYLCSQGFSTVYSLDGGFSLWSNRYPDQITTSDA